MRGVGPVLAAVFVAEIGDVTRFDHPSRLCSWAGLTPRHRQSDTPPARRITRQGSRLLRWAAVEAVSGRPGPPDRRREGPHRCPPKDEELPRGLVSVGRTASVRNSSSAHGQRAVLGCDVVDQ